MIKVDNKVKNIYYMLCYSFYGEKLNEKDEDNLGDEAFENIYNLFSLLLSMLLKKQIKKGIHKDYNYYIDNTNFVKGKININETIKASNWVNKKIVCEFDEYDENCLLNKVIKTSMHYLIKSSKIGSNTKSELKKLLIYFSKVDVIDIKTIKWDQIRFNRNNISYKYIVDLCRLILEGLIVSDKNGKNKYKEFLDDTRISSIYESFIRAYYRKHYPFFNASSRKININPINISYIPTLKTDITLEYENRMLIIDAKFYSKIINDGIFGSKVISNNNLNQIFVYVDSQDPLKSGNIKGMLLYSQTINEPVIDISYSMIGHDIFIKTLDMNSSWESITTKLNSIANDFINNL
jgi:5-methylcytosine-specific restriction enzyme subunit McrC